MKLELLKANSLIEGILEEKESKGTGWVTHIDHKMINLILYLWQDQKNSLFSSSASIYVKNSTITKFLGISRQQGNEVFFDDEGNRLSFVEKHLYNLNKQSVLIKNAIIPKLGNNNELLFDGEGKVMLDRVDKTYFSPITDFSLIQNDGKDKVYKIGISPIIMALANLEILNAQNNGIGYTKLELSMLGKIKNIKAIRLFEILKFKTRAKEGRISLFSSYLAEIFGVESRRLKSELDKARETLRLLVDIDFERKTSIDGNYYEFSYKFHDENSSNI